MTAAMNSDGDRIEVPDDPNQRELEELALEIFTHEAIPEWLTAGLFHKNWPAAFTQLGEAEATLGRLVDQGLVERVECDGGPVYRATKRAYRKAAA